MRLAASIALLVLPIAAVAQVYTWKDASGKVHYSDLPPQDRTINSHRLGPSNSESDNVIIVPKVATDKQPDADKKAAEAKEKAAQAQRDRADDAIRQQNCERAQQNLQGIESGQIRFRMGANGEREALDGSVRDAELAQARQAMDSNCSPRPAKATKK